MVNIRAVRTQRDADAVYHLAYEFIDWLHDRYPDMRSDIDSYMKHQKFDDQFRQVLTYYNPPKGECLLAVYDEKPVGILMFKDIADGVCEMNRLFVRQSARGLGVGRALVQGLKISAQSKGYHTMVLSALPRHDEAIALYHSTGFKLDHRRDDFAGPPQNAVLMRIDLGAGTHWRH